MEHTKQLLRVAEIETVAPYVNRYRFTAAQGVPAHIGKKRRTQLRVL